MMTTTTLRGGLLAGSSALTINLAMLVAGVTCLARPILAADVIVDRFVQGTYVFNGVGTNVIVTGSIVPATLPAIVFTDLSSGSTLTNSGFIFGIGGGVQVAGDVTALTNTAAGTIAGDPNAIIVENTGSIGALANAGLITGNISGTSVDVAGTVGTLTNDGRITNYWASGIAMSVSGSVGNLTNRGQIRSYNAAGLQLMAGRIGTLDNSGTLGAYDQDSNGAGISMHGGTITALSNSGLILGGTNQGIYIDNGSIGALTNSGTITGGLSAIHVEGGGRITTLANASDGTISANGEAVMVDSNSTIGTLSNGGTISGGTNAVRVGGGVTDLRNAGILISGGNAISVTGQVGTLTNSGTISGTSHAITVGGAGGIGVLSNSGRVNGNIAYAPATQLTITGGSGDVFGVLAGGTITTGGDLRFGGGNLLLADHVSMGGGNGTLTNAGTLQLNDPRTVAGDYVQDANGRLVIGVTPGSAGQLRVSKTATMANGQVVIKALDGAAFSGGQQFVIVDAGASSSYSGVTASATGYQAVASAVGNDLVVTLQGASSAYSELGRAVGGPAASMGVVMDRLAHSTDPATQRMLSRFDDLAPGDQAKALKQLAPSQTTPLMQMTSLSVGQTTGAIGQHQQVMMGGAEGTVGIAAGSEYRNKALWAQAMGGWAQQNTAHGIDGYRSHSYGVVVGADLAATPEALAGVAVSWLRARADGLDAAASKTTRLDSYQLTAYGTYRLGAAFLDGQAGLGINRYDQDRGVDFLGATAHAEYSGRQYLAKLTGGYDIATGATVVTPLAGVQAVRAVSDGYDESGAGAANLRVNDHAFNTLTSELGVKVAWTTATAWGSLTPEVTLAWAHDHTSSPVSTVGTLGGVAFATTTDRPAADAARLSMATTLMQRDELSLRLQYDGELREDYQSHGALLKARAEF